MFLSKHKNGIYYLYFFSSSGKRQKISTKSKIKAEALIFLTEFKKQLKQRSSDKRTLHEFIDEFSRLSQTVHTLKTQKGYLQTFKFLKQFFQHDLLLQHIKLNDIKEYLQQRKSLYQKRKDIIHLKRFFAEAFERNYIQENIMLRIKQVKIPLKAPKFFKDHEIHLLLQHADDLFKRIFLFALHTGCRQSEILELKITDVNFNDKMITVKKTKSHKFRSLPLNDVAAEVVKMQLQLSDERSIYLFEMKKSCRIKNNYLIDKFDKTRSAAKIRSDLTFHSFRHTFATKLVQKGVPIYEVKNLLGHSDIRTTEIYARLMTDDLRSAVSQLNDL